MKENPQKYSVLDRDIYKGETIVLNYSEGTKIQIIQANGINNTYEYPFKEINTSTWQAGASTAIIKTGDELSVKTFIVTDPIAQATAYNQYLNIIDEIDLVMRSRIESGGVLSTTINNKSLMNESSEVLQRLRAMYVRLANKEKGKIKGFNGSNPIKSIVTFKGK